jgi:ParB family transcriptional regulator, chromosome partitioning protein
MTPTPMEFQMKHNQELLLIKIRDLVPSPFNVRRYPPTAVAELAALIHSQGLLQHLIVTEQAVGKGRQQLVKFGVAAGERRRRALLPPQQQRKAACCSRGAVRAGASRARR